MVDDIICPKCSAQNSPDTIFCGKCGTKIDAADTVGGAGDPLIGSFVGDRFLVREKLGEGGMGAVYEAIQDKPRRRVAIAGRSGNRHLVKIAKKVEDELTYPGQIRVTVIRETRSIEYAK